MDEEITLGYLIDPFEQFQDTNGLPIISGIVEVYDEDTENLATIYKDFNQTLQTNPCPTDSLGNVTVIADGTKFYNIIVKDSEGNILLSKNHIKVSNSITETEIINQRAVVLPGEGINVVTTELGNTTNYTVSIDPDYSPINSISGDNGIEVSADGKDYTVYATSGIFSPVNGEYGVYTNIQDMGGGNYRLNVGLNHQGSCQMDGQSIAIGTNTTAIRQGFANGAQTNAADYCHAEGLLTTAAGQGTHAEGFTTNSYGYMCHSEGYQTTAGQYYSHAEGDNNRAEAVACHAEGQDTSAVTDYAHTEGYQTKAINGGKYGHAEGMNTIVSGYGAHSEGSYTSACGTCSHAEGHNTLAAADYSHAGGNNTIASGQYSTVIGNYNNPTLYDIFQIGAGSADDNRLNALTVDNNGDVTVYDNDLAGNISVSSYLKPKTYFTIHNEPDSNAGIRQTWTAVWGGADDHYGVVTAGNILFAETGYYDVLSNISIKGGESWGNNPQISHFNWSATTATSPQSIDTTGYNATYVTAFTNYTHRNTIYIPTTGVYTLYQPIITNNWQLPSGPLQYPWMVNITVSRG